MLAYPPISSLIEQNLGKLVQHKNAVAIQVLVSGQHRVVHAVVKPQE